MGTFRKAAFAAVLLTGAVVAVPAVAFAGQGGGRKDDATGQRTTICQVAGNGQMKVLQVGGPAAEHRGGSGALKPGDPVEGQAGYVVGPDCRPVLVDSDGDGVGDAEDNCPTVPNPDQVDTYGSSAGDACEDSNHDGEPDAVEANICISADGVSILQRGTASCTTIGGTSAMAHGAGARAAAQAGSGNRAVADGDWSSAIAQLGSGNTARATGPRAQAVAQLGDGNTATATGTAAGAFAGNGDRNTALAQGTCSAIASGGSDLYEECSR